MIYFDHAATSLPKPQPVIDAVSSAMLSMGNAARGTYGASLCTARTIYETREKLAHFFDCPRPDHVIFTSNATEAINLAIYGILKEGDHVITTDAEHNSVLRPLYYLERQRLITLDFVPADHDGKLQIDYMRKYVRENTALVAVCHASNVTGNVNDIERIGRWVEFQNRDRKRPIRYLVDAAQTAGVLPVSMREARADLLCFTGHKGLFGPQGTGGFCVAEGVALRPLKSGGSGVRSFEPMHPLEFPTVGEAGTLNGHGIAGLDAALDWLEDIGLEEVQRRERRLAERFVTGVRQIPGIHLYGDFSGRRVPIVSLNLGKAPSGVVSDILAQSYDIATRSGAHCAPRIHAALNTVEQGAVRFSFSHINREQEVDAALDALWELSRELPEAMRGELL